MHEDRWELCYKATWLGHRRITWTKALTSNVGMEIHSEYDGLHLLPVQSGIGFVDGLPRSTDGVAIPILLNRTGRLIVLYVHMQRGWFLHCTADTR